MLDDAFWVLTQDDLRGIHIFSEDFTKAGFGKKSLNYASFHNCKFKNADFQRTSLTKTNFQKCNLENAIFAMAGGYNTEFIKCNLKNTCMVESYFNETNFSGSDLSGAYLENAHLEKIIVSYNTIIDFDLAETWKNRQLPNNQKSELLKSFRIAHTEAEIWHIADKYFYEERVAYRKIYCLA